MFIDLHIHTNRYSMCSRLNPEDLIYIAKAFNLGGIVITEHNCIWDKQEINALKEKTDAGDLVILCGQEIRTYNEGFLQGDLLVFGFYDIIREEISACELVQKVHDAGGVIAAAHPFRSFLGLGNSIYELDLDAVEVLNSNHSVKEAQAAKDASAKLGLPAIGGSDAHCAVDVGNYLTFFENRIENEEQLVCEIKKGRCRPVAFSDIYKT